MTIYFDNAATTWTKPESVIKGMNDFNNSIGANPGRSGHHKSVEAGNILFSTREILAQLFNIADPLRIAFTSNITHSLNIILFGMLNSGDHLITSSIEHNSVMRPLRELEKRGVQLTIVKCDKECMIDPQDIRKSIKPNTKLILITHASNVTGTILPIEEIGQIASEHGIPFCIDSAQTAGSAEIDIKKFNIDLLCFTGHKGLFGPMGTGGLYIRNGLEKFIKPLIFGGTGSLSDSENQPDFMPDKYESGTLNVIGIAGLYEGVKFIQDTGMENINSKEISLLKEFIDGISGIKKITLYGTDNLKKRSAISSFNIDGISPSEISLYLDENYGIAARSGLHCAPAAHKTIGSFPTGTCRLSFSYFNTYEEVGIAVRAIHEISNSAGG
jgi:cysteine desulfurase family protein